MHSFILQRVAETPNSTWGDLTDAAGAVLAKILERGPRNSDHPRIPAGTYVLGRKPIGESKFDGHFRRIVGSTYKGILWLPDVADRTNIEIHTANLIEELEGCLASASSIGHDADGDYTALASSAAYPRLYEAVSTALDAGDVELVIKDIPARP